MLSGKPLQLFRYLVYSGLLWFVLHTTVVLIDGFTDDDVYADVGVVFGNTVNPDGSLSVRLQKRLDKGIDLFRQSRVKLLVVSGGLGKEGHYEGTKMKEYLILNDIPESNIVVDDLGNNTKATAVNVRAMNLPGSSVVVISQYHHISRAKLAFKKVGYQEVYGAHAELFEPRDFLAVVREFVAYYKYLLLF